MSRLEVDRDRCVGSGGCEVTAPGVFQVGDDGLVVVLRPQPAGDELPEVRRAVQGCPTRALRWHDCIPPGRG